jgi:hypothetical protein
MNFPKLVGEFDRAKNAPLTPRQVSFGSAKLIWWRCRKGPDHRWQDTPAHRTHGVGCPFCRGMRVSVTNSLATKAPEIARQWHPTRNGRLKPDQVTAGTGKLVWWKCRRGPDHEWATTVNVRGIGRTGCPFCSGHRISVTNRLSAVAPELAGQWDVKANGKLTPDDITVGSDRKVWWRCPAGPDHSWREQPQRRAIRKGCPFCANRLVSKTNCVATIVPAAVSLWHPTKNGRRTPHNTIAVNHHDAWWLCPTNPKHAWRAPVRAALVHGFSCAYCKFRRLSADNSLAARAPELALEWHPTKNGALTPKDVTASNNRKVWWRCRRDPSHEWQTTVGYRARGGGCKRCNDSSVERDRSLAVREPAAAKLWHPTRNLPVLATEVGATTPRHFWWKCPKGADHEWQGSPPVVARAQTPCPFCRGWRASITNCLAMTHTDVSLTWHPTRNSPLTPTDVLPGSRQPFWWLCAARHAWRATVQKQVERGGLCPTCGRRPAGRRRS